MIIQTLREMLLLNCRIGDVTLNKRTNWCLEVRGRFQRGRPKEKGFKEKEVITGSGTFTGGQKYKIVVRGSSPTSGNVIRGGGQ